MAQFVDRRSETEPPQERVPRILGCAEDIVAAVGLHLSKAQQLANASVDVVLETHRCAGRNARSVRDFRPVVIGTAVSIVFPPLATAREGEAHHSRMMTLTGNEIAPKKRKPIAGAGDGS